MSPLWTQLGDLMPMSPAPAAVPHVWRWNDLYPLAQRSRRPGPGRPRRRTPRHRAWPTRACRAPPTPPRRCGRPSSTSVPHETAPEHRHSQNAFRFVVEGEGVWTVVNGDPVAMRRGDFLLTPGWNFHGHHNDTDQPMAWIDGLDIPFVALRRRRLLRVRHRTGHRRGHPGISRSERLWGHPGLRPLSGLEDQTTSPIAAYRWEHTDAALREQLLLEDEGHPATVEQGHAAIRYTNPTTGGDVMPTISGRVPPAARRRRDPHPARGRVERLAGVRGRRHCRARRRRA